MGWVPTVSSNISTEITRDFGANTRAAKSGNIKIDTRIKSDLGLNNFTFVAANQWNQLPINIRNSDKVTSFTCHTKKWIMDNVAIS